MELSDEMFTCKCEICGEWKGLKCHSECAKIKQKLNSEKFRHRRHKVLRKKDSDKFAQFANRKYT